MEAAILFGNGINLLDNRCRKWSDLLKTISTDKNISKITSDTIKFEAIVLKDVTQKFNYEDSINIKKDKIASELNVNFKSSALERLSSLPVEHYITTNYDNSLMEYIDGKFKRDNFGERLYNIHRSWKNTETTIWKVHGDVIKPESIVLGYEQYGKSTSRIGQYVRGKYIPNHLSKAKPSILQKLNTSFPADTYSWIDLFFTHDIHIIGLGLYPEEYDLWWLLVYRMSIIKSHTEFRNKIFYYSTNIKETDADIIKMEALGIEVINVEREYGKQFDKAYDELIGKMEDKIKNRKKAKSKIKIK